MTRPGFGFRIFISALFCLAWLALAGNLCAQSSTTGSIVGIVTDPSGAALPGASIQLRNLGTGAQVTAHANGLGQYRFALLPPGSYQVTITAAGFRTVSRKVPVSLGQATTLNAALPITASTQVVNVTSEASVVQTNNANISTTYSARQIALTPNPGDDLTDIAQTAPGAVMNTEMGYGNFETYGLPATANLFTLNGEDDNDPFECQQFRRHQLIAGAKRNPAGHGGEQRLLRPVWPPGGRERELCLEVGHERLAWQCELFMEWPGYEQQ